MKLQKLKNASLHELRVRAAQQISAFSERRGWSSLIKLPSDDSFSSSINSSQSEPAFFPGFQSPEATGSAFKSRWPESAEKLIDKADRIVAGKFDLLGFKDLHFGDPID